MPKYEPTEEEKLRVKPLTDILKVSDDQIFASLQGEGITAGKPAVFLRLHYCNLACSWCDTKYTWDNQRKEYWQEPVDWSIATAAEKIKSAWDEKFGVQQPVAEKRVVITGGEPLLQQRKIVQLIKLLPGWTVEIETNGTIELLPELEKCQINCSPKLSNSGNPLRKRYKPKVLKRLNYLPNSWFKFVVTTKNDFVEIEQIVTDNELDREKIIIMPEGITLETMVMHRTLIANTVKNKNWRLTMRNQLIWFGSKRRT